jgi:carbamoyltransferase
MNIIGISAFYHDSSACLFQNGELVFACEEEKFTGIKHDSSFPSQTINYILDHYGLSYDDIDVVCYYEDLDLKFKRIIANFKRNFFKSPKYCFRSIFKFLETKKKLKKFLEPFKGKIFFSEHHSSHQYYSFFSSEFGKAICLSIDGVGEIDTLTFGVANGENISYQSLGQYPHSLGLYYSCMTSFLGFKPNEGEYKLMGLAPYGDPNLYIEKIRELISFENGKLICNMNLFSWDQSDKLMFGEKLMEHLSMTPRMTEEAITQDHKNLAASVQLRYEEVLFDVIEYLEVLGCQNLCLGGGSAYNGTANGKITSNSHIDKIWIPPAPSDAGSCIGAVLNYLVNNNIVTNRLYKSPFLGPKYESEDFVKGLKNYEVEEIESSQKLFEIVAKEIYEGKIIGWYRDRIEFGARALGNRSILADPTRSDMKSRINKVIKKREGFRPFAPMVIQEKQKKYFDVIDDVPYMNQIVKVKKKYSKKLSAVVHVDGTSRIQTVYKDNSVYNLLTEFEKLSGVPVLLNTSFNVKDKTMVLTPQDAIDTFEDTELDLLIIDNYIIKKRL